MKIIPTSLDYSTIWERVRNMDKFKIVSAEVTSNEAESASNTVKDLKEKGKEVKRFYGDKAYDGEIYNLGVDVVVPPRENASTRRGHPARRKAVREFKELGYDRWREERGYGVRWRVESLFSAVKRTFGESVRATSFLGQVVEAKLKFWAYAWMMYMANLVVGRAKGFEVKK
jgi:hypothetical protein